jgi:hypothetical protein
MTLSGMLIISNIVYKPDMGSWSIEKANEDIICEISRKINLSHLNCSIGYSLIFCFIDAEISYAICRVN